MIDIRALIIEEISRHYSVSEGVKRWPHCPQYYFYPTWWLKFKVPATTAECRAELKRMERDGIVVADRGQSNNTLWALKDYLPKVPE